jgi:Zn-finger nucleic acid-binding protein
VEIDYRPQRRGVWLERGELDKIIERLLQTGGPDRETQKRYRDDEYRQSYHGKKKSFLGQMFDFD